MADGFGGVPFLPLREGGLRGLPSRKAAVTVRHAVGGDTTYFDFGGRLAGDWRGILELASETILDNLTTKLGTSDTLVLNGVSYTAILLGIEEVKLRPTGSKLTVTAQFAVAV